MLRLTRPLVAGRPVVQLSLAAGAGTAMPSGSSNLVITVPALIDTGAKQSCVDLASVGALGLAPVTTVGVRTASTGRSPLSRNVYNLSLAIGGTPPMPWMSGLRVIAIDLSWSPERFLLGRDVLARCRFEYDGPADRFTLEF